MALDADALTTAMKDATEGISSSAADALNALGNAIADYIMANAVVNFSWNGVQPGSPPVTENTSTTGKIMGLSFSLTPSMANGQPQAINTLKSQLIAGLSASQYNITAPGFSTTAQAMSTSGAINSLNVAISGNNRNNAFNQLATCIITWVKAQMPTGAILGSHGSFTAPAGTGGLVTGIS